MNVKHLGGTYPFAVGSGYAARQEPAKGVKYEEVFKPTESTPTATSSAQNHGRKAGGSWCASM
jgi:hypothetical protein